ncbi:MAG: EthD domain-containing protein [Novosphingobium sp.]
MIKQVSVMKRHPSLTMEEFIEQYEGRHAKFGEVLFKKAKKLTRRYVQPQPNPLTGKVEELDFDVILELWFENEADLKAAMAGIPTSGIMDEVRESGARLFASSANPAFTVLEYESPVGGD